MKHRTGTSLIRIYHNKNLILIHINCMELQPSVEPWNTCYGNCFLFLEFGPFSCEFFLLPVLFSSSCCFYWQKVPCYHRFQGGGGNRREAVGPSHSHTIVILIFLFTGLRKRFFLFLRSILPGNESNDESTTVFL